MLVRLPSAHIENVYKQSVLAEKTRATRFWSVLDLDGTFAAGCIEARRAVRAALEKRGALLFSTARTPELVMSSRAFSVSHAHGNFSRAAPRWVKKGSRYQYAPLEELPEFEDVLDPDAILGFGEGVCIKTHLDGNCPYLVDREYERLYLDPPAFTEDGVPWRQLAMEFVYELGINKHLNIIEWESAYRSRLANVESLTYRIQLDFKGPEAVAEKYRVLSEVQARQADGPLAGRIEGVDESKPSDDPAESRATLYLMPPQARKENMLNRTLTFTCHAARVSTASMQMLIAGDTLTDFYAGCYAGWDADVTFILVGGCRLAKCIEEKANFAGVDLRRFHNALKPTSRPGFYLFDNPLMRGGWTKRGKSRMVILGDQAYPGTIGAETILAYLQDSAIASYAAAPLQALA